VFEAVLEGFVEELKAWGVNTAQTHDVCVSAHRGQLPK
jgi:hypothetical protein